MKKQFMKGLAASLILALSVTTVTPAMAAEKVAPKAAESTAKTMNTDAVYNGYLSIIQKYKVAQDHDFYRNDDYAGEKSGINLNARMAGTKEVYYSLIDISNDGTPELFIADLGSGNADYHYFGGYNMLDSYTYAQGGLHRLRAQGYKWYDSIMTNNAIQESFSSGALDNYKQFYTLPKNGTALVPGSYIEHVSWTGNQYYLGYGDLQNKHQISKAEYDAIASKYVFKKDIQWHAINDLKPLKKAFQKENAPVKIMLNGQELKCDQPPIIKNNRTLVPFRAILEGMNAQVGWDDNTRIVTASLDGIDLSLKIGSKTMYKNGQPIPLDVPAQIINSRTLIPARAVTEALGAKVDWDANTRTVYVVQGEEALQEESNAKAYESACDLFNLGYSYNAYYAFQKLGNYKDSPQKMQDAKLLNYFSYIYGNDLENIAIAKRTNGEKLYNNDIKTLMPSRDWLYPGVQYLGYEFYHFTEDHRVTHSMSGGPYYPVEDVWIPSNNGLWIIDGAIDPNGDLEQRDFRKIAEGVYVNYVLCPNTAYSTMVWGIFIDESTKFADGYSRTLYRLTDTLNGSFSVRKDQNGMHYLVRCDQYGNILETLKS